MKSAAERQRQWRQNRKADGYQMHTVWLDPDIATALDQAIESAEPKQAKRQQIINEALRKLLL